MFPESLLLKAGEEREIEIESEIVIKNLNQPVMLAAADSLLCELPCFASRATRHGLNRTLVASQGDGRDTKDAFDKTLKKP